MAQQQVAGSATLIDNAQGPGEAHAGALLENYILMELVLDVARTADDPQRKLAEIFDRVTARARFGAHTTETKPVMSDFHELAQAFFLSAGKRA